VRKIFLGEDGTKEELSLSFGRLFLRHGAEAARRKGKDEIVERR